MERVPLPGEIVHASETWEQAGGGGSVAALQLSLLADSVSFFTALGSDELGRRAKVELEERGIEVHAAFVEAPQRRAFTFVDETGERTITTIGRSGSARAATTTRCRGTSSRAATRCTSARGTWMRSCSPGARACSS